MRVHIFAPGAVPGVDQPILRKSQSYVDGMISRGQATMLQSKAYYRPAAQMTGKAKQEMPDREKFAADTWIPMQSGYAGPIVMQIPRSDSPVMQ